MTRHSRCDAGMTETSPLATVGGLKTAIAALPEDQQLRVIEKAGRPHILVGMRIVDDSGKTVGHDGTTSGKLQVRGHMVLKEYYKVSCLFHSLLSLQQAFAHHPVPEDHPSILMCSFFQI